MNHLLIFPKGRGCAVPCKAKEIPKYSSAKRDRSEGKAEYRALLGFPRGKQGGAGKAV